MGTEVSTDETVPYIIDAPQADCFLQAINGVRNVISKSQTI